MPLLNSRLMATALASPRMVRLLKRSAPALDKALLRVSGGRVNTAMQPVVLLRTVGARSGAVRDIATLCMPDGDDLLLVGSNWGQDRDPAWVWNLRANPRAKVWFRGYVGPVHASELADPQRRELWPRLVAYNPQYDRYQQRTARPFPVMRLRRAAPD